MRNICEVSFSCETKCADVSRPAGQPDGHQEAGDRSLADALRKEKLKGLDETAEPVDMHRAAGARFGVPAGLLQLRCPYGSHENRGN